MVKTGGTAAATGGRRRWIPSWARRTGVVLVTALVLEYMVVPQFVGARSALDVLSGVSSGFLALGLGLEMLSLMSYSALTRCVLPAPNRPSFWTVLRVDISALGVSHLLPGGGATASALRYRLFTVAGMAPADVLSATAIEGFGAAVVLAMVFTAGLLLALPTAADNPYLLAAAAASALLTAAAGAAVVLLTRHQTRTVHCVRAVASAVPRLDPDTAQRLVDSLASRLNAMAAHPRLMARTLIWASANWLFDAASLWVFLRAFGTTEGLQGMLVGYGLAGVLALVPVSPGGLGIVEGTLVSLLVGFGTSHAQAVLGVITWRLAEFWLPIPLAALTYLSLRTGTLRRHRLPARPVIPRWPVGSAPAPAMAGDAALGGAPTPGPHVSGQHGSRRGAEDDPRTAPQPGSKSDRRAGTDEDAEQHRKGTGRGTTDK